MPFIKKGDCIGIAASSSPFDKTLFLKGVQVLKKMGFQVHFRRDIFSKQGYLAGSDKRRVEELTGLITNKKIKAVFFARGGYGSQRIIPYLNPKLLRKHRKPIVGFSDVTALLTFLRQKAGFPTIYGPVITQLGNKPHRRTIESLKTVPTISLKGCKILKRGKAKGKLVGGCLSLIVSSLGTPYALETKNKILFFEDTDEKTYALDRMLTQLKNAGALKSVRGILIGTLAPAKGDPHSIVAMLKERFKDFKGPVVFGIPSGHTKDFVSLPLGKTVSLDTQKRKLVL